MALSGVALPGLGCVPGVPRSPPLASGHLRHPGARSLPLAESCVLFPWLILSPLLCARKGCPFGRPCRPRPGPTDTHPALPSSPSSRPAPQLWGGSGTSPRTERLGGRRSSLCPQFRGGWMGPARAGISEPCLPPSTGPAGAATVPCVCWQRRLGEIRRIWQRRARGQTCFFFP